MKVAVAGSRSIKSIDFAEVGLSDGDIVITGGAVGVDTVAERMAITAGHEVIRIVPDYRQYGRAATHIRNRQIVDAADRVVVFWDGVSKGSKSVIDYGLKHGKEVKVIRA